MAVAAVMPPTSLRTFDAIHLASVLHSGLEMIGYDSRLKNAAAVAGVQVYSPGTTTSQ
jgi:predicted nucleic acid-binding protein